MRRLKHCKLGRRLEELEDAYCPHSRVGAHRHTMPPRGNEVMRTHEASFYAPFTTSSLAILSNSLQTCLQSSQHLQSGTPAQNLCAQNLHSISLARNALHKPITCANRMASAILWTLLETTHLLTSSQQLVLQDLQGPPSSLRVGPSVRTSTRPLSGSLLHLCLRYLTCIQRR